MIWRLYHLEAFLTLYAEVYVSGSDTRDEHHIQIYTAASQYTNKPCPNFTINFSSVTSLDRVVFDRLVGPLTVSLPYQGQIVLACTVAGSTATCTTPPNNYIAPPGCDYLFVLYKGIP
ncbi:MAG: hypothetical protein FRX49_04421, partial [Trebouxia sp. A1-2]